ncbi:MULTISPECIES: DUF421 domain-containing protein [Gordonia]|uniref:DUF421 domain-containing protein n=1 Tax=Gordonia aquimaris TaxID=2984863 RepID=A0A9X3D387_9ACTN|nr:MULTISPECIES: YetF domain-containing protein [Gordonia]MAU80417.1 hypothetical protein [Gordonia sp. (in: high G+C Gram-positive bacteria)]MCX2964223.1 DUF421 domain-containing protein [Gordonia aquimaris]MDY6809183.1 DUF421 domain-containing protein [Actinomycetota bacterium]
MWFDSWSDIIRVLAVGTAAYATLVVTLRISGKRTLAKLNAFDLVVTVALGSTLATILLSSDVSFAEGVVALAVLAALQYVVAWVTTRRPGVRSAVTARPTLLVDNGVVLAGALARQRVAVAEVHQAIRAAGVGDVDAVAAVVLETDGSISVVATGKLGDGSALEDVDRPDESI